MSFKCQIFTKRLTLHNVLELSCDVRIIIFLFCLIAILPPNIKCAKLQNPQIRLLINDDDLLQEKTSRHEAAAAAVEAASVGASIQDNSGEHFNLYRSELKRLSYETIHRILRDENEPSYRREETELRYYQKRSPSAYEESHQLIKRSAAQESHHELALNYSKRKLREFVITGQLQQELNSATSLDLSDNLLSHLNISSFNNSNLHSLNLSNNSLTNIPLSENSTLKSLNLNGNAISNSAIAANINLHNLYLACNKIENLPALNLSMLKNLITLDISCNRLKNLETSFFPERMHNLKHLNLAHNRLSAIYRETFYNLLSLNTLLLAHNNITDIDYETFLALPNLQYLDLSFNRLKGKSIRALQGITGLVALNIAFNPQLGPFMQEFVASWSLKELDASGTGLCQIPAALAQSVRSLKLTHNWLKIINCGDLDSYPLLQYLDLSFSHIEHIEDDALGRLEILEILMLDNNELKRIPISLPVSLEHLFLQNNNILDIQFQSFQGLINLKTLDLSHNKLLYLPDIALPKLQTLNLQSAGIRGISQGIVHTLPRLTELLLEDNPIKCSDLLGIAEWSSTCRLRSSKDEMEENGVELDDDDEENANNKMNLKTKYLKIYDFYEKFGSEHCQQNLSLQQLNSKPVCTQLLATPIVPAQVEHEQQVAAIKTKTQTNADLRGATTLEQIKVANFNINSMMAAIPIPAKKALRTLTESPNKTTAATNVDGVAIEMPPTVPLQTLDSSKVIEKQQILNNNTKTLLQTTSSSMNGITTEPTAEILQTFEALASADKPQEHASQTNNKTRIVASNFTTNAAFTDAVKGLAIKTVVNNSKNNNSNIAMPGMLTQQLIGVATTKEEEKETSTESLRTANLPEILKQNMAESIINSGNKQHQILLGHNDDDEDEEENMTATTLTTVAAAAVYETETGKAAYAAAINSPLAQRATTMATTTASKISSTFLSATGATRTETTAAATTITTETTSKPVINLLKEKLRHEKEIKTKIGLTKEIKSFQRFTMAPPAASSSLTTLIPSSSSSFGAATENPSSDYNTKMEGNSNASHKELNDFATSKTTGNTNTADATTTSNNHSTPYTTAAVATTTIASTSPFMTIEPEPVLDKDLASHYSDNDRSSKISIGNNGSTFDKMGGNDNIDGQNNKTLVTLHITTPITPNIVVHSNDHQLLPPLASKQLHHEESLAEDDDDEEEDEQITAAIQQPTQPSHNDVNAGCTQSNSNACTSDRPQRQEEHETAVGITPTMLPTIKAIETTTIAVAAKAKTTTATDAMTFNATSTTAAEIVSTTLAATTAATATKTTHKHEPLQLHIKDRHLIGTPLLMHKGDNLMVAADELIKTNHTQNDYSPTLQSTTPTTPITKARATLAAIRAFKENHVKAKSKQQLAKSQRLSSLEEATSKPSVKANIHHEPFEHKGETIKTKDYTQLKKSNAPAVGDIKTKKPSLIMKKMTIITKQHESTTTVPSAQGLNVEPNDEQQQQRDFLDSHYMELKPQHAVEEAPLSGHQRHSTVNTPINRQGKQLHLLHEPQTFQHEHELLLQQVLHDQQQQDRASQSEQWSDVRKGGHKANHPGLILLVSLGLFVVLLLGLMHVYRCDVPWRRNSPAHHLRPHQNGSLEEDAHSFLSYSEGMQKWHHSTRLEAPYSSPLHNLHVRELQKTTAIEKPATFKSSTTSAYKSNLTRSHFLPRNNSQSSSNTTRTTSPSSSAILDDETFYIEMTPPSGQFAQAIQSELLPMELLNMAQSKSLETNETSADLQTSLEEDYDYTACAVAAQHVTPYKSTTVRSELLTSSSPASSSYNQNSSNNNKALYNSRKFGMW